MHYFVILNLIFFLGGCSGMAIEKYADQKPRFVLEDYFSGKTTAEGLFIDRFGTLKRQFTVDIKGTWDDKKQELKLVEDFVYSDGEEEQRIWTIKKEDNHNYIGYADGVVGKATGKSYGNALQWRYDFDLKVKDSTIRVHFNDWMFLQPNKKTMINKATVTKWGIEIGEAIISFSKK